MMKKNIAIIGLGYVGLPLLLSINAKKFKVVGFDHNKKLINDLKKNKPHIEDVSEDDFLSLDKKNLKQFSACLILADHDYIDYTSLQKSCKLIIDTRGRFENKHKNVTQL